MVYTATWPRQPVPRRAAEDFRGPQASGRSVCAHTRPLPSEGKRRTFESCRVGHPPTPDTDFLHEEPTAFLLRLGVPITSDLNEGTIYRVFS
jgi:hypothetical protein